MASCLPTAIGRTCSNSVENGSSNYFTSYGDIGVHELMLKDQPRTLAYKEFIEKNKHLFQNKAVLDVGAGSGILSLFAASAGARHVYAVEASDMSEACWEIVCCNNMQDRISVIHGKIEEIDLPVNKVDVVISEWMGFYLLHESMLDSVIFARDKWLAEDGIMVPSHATLYLTPVNMDSYIKEHFQFWDNVYGYNFQPLKESAMKTALQQPLITSLSSRDNISEPETVLELYLQTTTLEEIQKIKRCLSFSILKQEIVHGFACWFDIDFTAPSSACDQHVQLVTLSTAPSAPETHWKQTVFFLPSAISVQQGEIIHCWMELSQDEVNKRHYNIAIELQDEANDDKDDKLLSASSESSESDFDEDEIEDDGVEHPVPCNCGSGRCKLILAIMNQYETEHAELENEAEFVDVTAEVEAAKNVDLETMKIGEDINSFDTDSSQ